MAALAVAYIVRLAAIMPKYGTDFDPIRFSARLLLHGENPYETLGPGLKYFWNFRLLYPLPAVLIGMPFLGVPIVPARALFAGAGAFTATFLLSRKAWWPLIALASAPFWSAVGFAQWSPWLLSAAMLPPLGFVLAAKPNIGLAVLAFADNLRAFLTTLAGVAGITLLSFVVMPNWVASWLDAIRGAEHVRPIATLVGGFLPCFALLKWRRPEARLLVALTLLPQNPAIYEALLLFLIPASMREALILSTTSWFVEMIVDATGPHPTFASAAIVWGYALLICMYVPAVLMVLLRPNEGTIPSRLESAIRNWPRWIRGVAPAGSESMS